MNKHIERLANKWDIEAHFLEDVYYMLNNDIRFSSSRSPRGVRYKKMSDRLKNKYEVPLEPYHLEYLVLLVRNKK